MSPWLLVPVGIVLVWAWFSARTVSRLRADLDQAEARLARRIYKLQGKVTEMDAVVHELDFERRRRRGEIRFGPESTIADVVAVHPRLGEILAGFGLVGSGCSGGGLDGGATLAGACSEASLELRAVLQALDAFVTDPDAKPAATVQSAKLHRIQLPR
ncbi:MAG: hypothetical protein ACT4PE_15515 [Candidatus Eiseniibacteriota bacterium]